MFGDSVLMMVLGLTLLALMALLVMVGNLKCVDDAFEESAEDSSKEVASRCFFLVLKNTAWKCTMVLTLMGLAIGALGAAGDGESPGFGLAILLGFVGGVAGACLGCVTGFAACVGSLWGARVAKFAASITFLAAAVSQAASEWLP